MEVKKLTPTVLSNAIGTEAATTLMSAFGGRIIPRLSPFHVEHRQRDARIRAWVKHNGYKSAAEQFGLSERRVRQIMHGY